MAIDRSERLLTVNEVAERLRIHPITVRRHIKAGRLRAVRIGRSVRIGEAAVTAMSGQRPSPGALPYPWPRSAEETRKLRRIVEEMRKERATMKPLGMSTVDLVRAARRDLEERYRKPPRLGR